MRNAALGILMFLVTGAATAATTVPHTFTAGTAAKASEVNENFAALATAIDGLAARVDKLEGTVTMATVAGTYTFFGFHLDPYVGSSTMTPYSGSTTTTAYTLIKANKSTITLNADGSGSISGDVNDITMVSWVPSFMTKTTDNSNGTFTWSLSGGEITLSNGVKFEHAAGGRLFMNVGDSYNDPSAPQETEHYLYFLLRN